MRLSEQSLNSNKRPQSFRTSSHSSTIHNYSYPYKYEYSSDNEVMIENEIDSQLISAPKIGSKIDEVFDAYFEDSLFRIFYPETLPFSPLAAKFLGRTRNIRRNNLAAYTIFRTRISENWIQLNNTLYRESLLDAGISNPADLIVDESNSHINNRRSVYEAANDFVEMSLVHSNTCRSLWRFTSHFIVYFVKGVFSGFGMYLADRYLIPILSLS